MKYMLLMSGRQGDWTESGIGTWDPEDVKAHIDFMRLVGEELTESGELVGGEGLAPPEQAKVVRAESDGLPAVTETVRFRRPRSSSPVIGSSTSRVPSER